MGNTILSKDVNYILRSINLTDAKLFISHDSVKI